MSGSPVYVQAVVAGIAVFFSSGIAGLTSFGDAIMYLAIMGVLRVSGVYFESTRESVFNITLMTATTLPYMTLEMTGGPLRARFRDGLLLSLTGVSTVFVGFWLLQNVETSVLGYFIGALFLLFSTTKLTYEIMAWRRETARPIRPIDPDEAFKRVTSQGPSSATSQEPHAHATPGQGAVASRDATEVTSPTISASDVALALSSTSEPERGDEDDGDEQPGQRQDGRILLASRSGEHKHELDEEDDLNCTEERPLSYHWSIGDGYIPPQWPACLPPFWRAPAVLLVAGLGAGILGGMLGVHGPPIVVGFSLLRLGKDETRATFVVFAILSLIVRLVLFVQDGVDSSRWPVYVTVCVVSVSSFLLGTWLRQGLDGPTVMRCLLGIVLAGSCLQLGVTESPVAAGVVLPVVAVWGGIMGYWVWKGHKEQWWVCEAACGYRDASHDGAGSGEHLLVQARAASSSRGATELS